MLLLVTECDFPSNIFWPIRWILDREGGREMLRGVAVMIVVRSGVLSLGLGRADCLHKTEEVIS